MEEPHSIVEYFAEHDRYRCGYCGQKDTNYSHVMWAHQMSVQDYQGLIDRGWRRSGKTVYKPTMNLMCCPHYTIRCHAIDFKLSKSHKKQIKRINRYLITGVKPGGDGTEEDGDDLEEKKKTKPAAKNASENKNKTDSHSTPHKLDSSSTPHKKDSHSTPHKRDSPSTPHPQSQEAGTPVDGAGSSGSSNQAAGKHVPRPGSGADPNKPKCRKAKELRAERKAMKMSLDDTATQKCVPQKKAKQNQEKTLEELLTEPDRAENPAHRLEIKLCRSAPVSEEFRKSFKVCHGVFRKYQMAVHKDKPQDCDISGYQNFLVDSPLQEQHGPGAPPMGYGSFHQQYWLDDKLVAVGVVDILPTSLSSVYLYYDPEYSFLALGVYSALREIMFVRELQRSAPALKYYYMGFYIHSCPKMRYKGQFHPSDLACPESYEWVPLPQCLPKLELSPYARLSAEDLEDKDNDISVAHVLVLNRGKVLPYGLYRMMKPQITDEETVREYAGFVGKTCAERMFLVRQ